MHIFRSFSLVITEAVPPLIAPDDFEEVFVPVFVLVLDFALVLDAFCGTEVSAKKAV